MISSHKTQYPGKLLSKCEGKIKAFLDLKVLKNFSCFASFFGKLLEIVIHQIKKFIKKEIEGLPWCPSR